MPAVQAALVCVLLGGSAIGYVYQKNKIIALGQRIQEREKYLAGLKSNTAKLKSSLVTLQSESSLVQRNRQLNLGLVQPAQSQILTIIEVPAVTATSGEPPRVERPAVGIAHK